MRSYQVQGDACKTCKRQPDCFKQTGIRRRILGSSCYPAFYRGMSALEAYVKYRAEGSFAVLKREHCLSKVRKRDISAVTEECLFSVMALNLKGLQRSSFCSYLCSYLRSKIWTGGFFSSPYFILSTGPLLCTLFFGLVTLTVLKQALEFLINCSGLEGQSCQSLTGSGWSGPEQSAR